ncbi:MAG: HAMP domain-containing histidine kinase [Kutzneria sp.]|nr:HAMP domain-containing histidine kinase [Kutzneria sp.]
MTKNPITLVARVFRRWPLRVHLILGLLVLLAVALFGAWYVNSRALQNYLLNQSDTRLRIMMNATERQMNGLATRPPRPGGENGRGFRLPGRSFVILRTGEQTRELETPRLDRNSRPSLPAFGRLPTQQAVTVSSKDDSGIQWRVLTHRTGNTEVVVATDQIEMDAAVSDLRRNSLLISLGVLVLAAGLGYILVRSSLRPLEEVESTAEVIATGELSRRVPVHRPGSEVGRLASTLNMMLGRIEDAFSARKKSEAAARSSENRMRQFVADASHELRTPLTSIRGYAELYRQGAASTPQQIARVLRGIEDQAARMGLLVDDLLLLARLDQQRPLAKRLVDLAVIAVDAVHEARMLAPDRQITLHLNVNAADVPTEEGVAPAVAVLGDEARLRQVVINLVGNALTHTPPETPVEVRLDRRTVGGERFAVLEVADQGQGLTAEQADKVFERFYRADAARSRKSGGTGLGLAIVSALVVAHGGRVELDTAPDEGATFRVLLPELRD